MCKIVLLLFIAFCSIACVRDHLYYATTDMAVVRLNIDWSTSKFSPNGVTVYVYDSNGDRYGSSVLSSNTEQVTMTLPSDTYTIVVHNDSRSEFSNVEFSGSSKLSTFMVRSLEWSHTYYETKEDEFMALEPEDIVAATVRNVVVPPGALKYHYDKPDLSEYTSTEIVEVDITPAYIVHLAEVQPHIESAEGALSIPISLVHGMSRGYHFGNECTLEDRVLEVFAVDVTLATSSSDPQAVVASRTDEEYVDDNLYADYRTFGLPFDMPDDGEDGDTDGDGMLDDLDKMHTVDSDFHDVWVNMLFYTSENLFYDLYAEVTEAISVEDVGVRMKYTIALNDDLNNYEPYYDDEFVFGDDDLEDGTFDPSLDPWVDIVVPLPM